MSYLLSAFISLVVSVAGVWGIYNYAPMSVLSLNGEPRVGSTITTINGGDTLSSSRTVINDNFSALNNGKIENSTTSLPLITSLSALATVGTITSGTWSGTALTVAKGSTGTTTGGNTNGISYYNGTYFTNLPNFTFNGSLLNFPNASSTALSALKGFFGATATSSIGANGYYGFGTSTPFSAVTLDRIAGTTAAATSSITVTEYNSATSTAGTIDARDSNSILWRIGASATTLTLTGFVPGKQLVLTVCNGAGSAGAITWATLPAGILRWAGGALPSQTTSANRCDVWSFRGSNGTSTPIILGAVTSNF